MGGSALFAHFEPCSLSLRAKGRQKQNKINMKKKLRTVAMMLALALPVSLLAQGGLFQRGDNDETNHGQSGEANKAMLLRNGEAGATLSNQGFGNPNGSNLTNQTFNAPIGSGLLIMLLAGAGYSAMKSNKKNNENKE